MSESVYGCLQHFVKLFMSTKGDENEEIYIFTGLYILDELETKK